MCAVISVCYCHTALFVLILPTLDKFFLILLCLSIQLSSPPVLHYYCYTAAAVFHHIMGKWSKIFPYQCCVTEKHSDVHLWGFSRPRTQQWNIHLVFLDITYMHLNMFNLHLVISRLRYKQQTNNSIKSMLTQKWVFLMYQSCVYQWSKVVPLKLSSLKSHFTLWQSAHFCETESLKKSKNNNNNHQPMQQLYLKPTESSYFARNAFHQNMQLQTKIQLCLTLKYHSFLVTTVFVLTAPLLLPDSIF